MKRLFFILIINICVMTTFSNNFILLNTEPNKTNLYNFNEHVKEKLKVSNSTFINYKPVPYDNELLMLITKEENQLLIEYALPFRCSIAFQRENIDEKFNDIKVDEINKRIKLIAFKVKYKIDNIDNFSKLINVDLSFYKQTNKPIVLHPDNYEFQCYSDDKLTKIGLEDIDENELIEITKLLIDKLIKSNKVINNIYYYKNSYSFFNKKDFQYFDKQGQRLFEYIKNNDTGNFKKFFKKKDIQITNEDGWNLLLESVLHKRLKMIKFLISNDINLNARSKREGLSPLMMASAQGDMKTVKLLVNKNCKLDLIDNSGSNALIFALDDHNSEIAKYLVKKGINTNIITNEGMTPLMYSIKENELSLFNILINTSKLNFLNNVGESALMLSVINNNLNMVNSLVLKNADLNLKDNQGWPALTYAARYGYIDVAKVLIKNGAKINEGDNFGYTPLMIAVLNSHVEIVKLLCENGANKTLKVEKGDKTGYTALKFAEESGYQEIVNVFLKY